MDWTWTRDGRRRYFSELRHADGRLWVKSFEGTDGSTEFQAGGGTIDEPATVALTADGGGFRMPWCRGLAGLWWSADGCWLPDLLEEEGRVTLDGHEEIEGLLCPRLRCALAPGLGVKWTLLLDPRHRFLPREVREDFGNPGESARYVVTEFREVAAGVPFPVAGAHTYGVAIPESAWRGESEWSWKATDVSLDGPLPAVLFRPPIGPQTKATDATKPPVPAAAPTADDGEASSGFVLAAALIGVVAAAVVIAVRRCRGT